MSRVKTSVMVDKELWDKFRRKVGGERGLRSLSEAVEEAIEDELSELVVSEGLPQPDVEGLSADRVEPVRPKVKTSAAETLRELRGGREPG